MTARMTTLRLSRPALIGRRSPRPDRDHRRFPLNSVNCVNHPRWAAAPGNNFRANQGLPA